MEKRNNIVGDPNIQKLQDRLVKEHAEKEKLKEELGRDLLLVEEEIRKAEQQLSIQTQEQKENQDSKEFLEKFKKGLSELKDWRDTIKKFISEADLIIVKYEVIAENYQKQQNKIKETIMKLQPGQEN